MGELRGIICMILEFSNLMDINGHRQSTIHNFKGNSKCTIKIGDESYFE